ncbi:MAG: hypothetical protein SGCHY_002603 [Lobulomycetales sp.]
MGHSETDSERGKAAASPSSRRRRNQSSTRIQPQAPPQQAHRGALICLRATQILFAIGVMVALGVSWHVRSYGSVFNSHDMGGLGGGVGGAGLGGVGAVPFGGPGFGGPGLGGPGFGGPGFGGPGFGGPGFGGGFGLLGPGMGGEDGLGFSEFGMAYGFYRYPFSSIAYTVVMVVAALSFLTSIGFIFAMGSGMIQVGVDVLFVILWIVSGGILASNTSICMPHDRDRMFIYYQIQEMLAFLPWNFAAQFEWNINVYCGGAIGGFALSFLQAILFIVSAVKAAQFARAAASKS